MSVVDREQVGVLTSLVCEGGSRVLVAGPGLAALAREVARDPTRLVARVAESAADADDETVTLLPATPAEQLGESLEERYDVVVLAGLLERCAEPARVLGSLREHGLTGQGYLVVPILNAAHPEVLTSLLTGPGAGSGEPLRPFTRNSLTALAEGQGLQVSRVRRLSQPRGASDAALPHVGLTAGSVDLEPDVRGYVFRLDPMDAAKETALVREKLEQERRRFRQQQTGDEERFDRLQAQRDELIAKLSRDLAETRRHKQEVTAELKDELRTLRRRAKRQSKTVRRERQRAERLQQQLDKVYASTTWRTGDVVLRVPKRLMSRRRAR